MVKYVNKSIVLFLVFLLLLIIVPSTFASDAVDNQTVVSSDEQIEISAVNDGGVIYSHSGDTSDVLTGSNDIYFNASADSDGKGTQSSPYKYLQYNRLTSGCTAHFADGTYNLDAKKEYIHL